MPVIAAANDFTGQARPNSPEEHQIDASTCLTTYLYNIPPGVITTILPGLSVLAAGLVFFGLSLSAADQSNLAEGLPQLAVVTVAVGGGWTALAVGFWVVSCFQYRLRTCSRTATKDCESSVELIAVIWIDNDLHPYRF